MKPLQHIAAFPTLGEDISSIQAEVLSTGNLPEGDTLYEAKMWYVLYLLQNNRAADAGLLIDTLNYEPSADVPLIYTAWLWLARMSIYVEKKDAMMAVDAAEHSLRALDDIQLKKGEDFLAVLASILYNLALVHNLTGENSRATKELSKSQKLFERLAKKNEPRFATMLTYAVEASTVIFSSRQKQMEVFARYQDLADQYSGMVEGGNEDAMEFLVDSLGMQGEIMLQMGNPRDAMKYFTKALRYYKRIHKDMDRKELRLSIGLSKALMRITGRREQAGQLLVSLQALARRLGANDALKEIEELLDSKSKSVTIMSLLKGIF